MRAFLQTVRGRLTLWYVVTLALLLLIFAVEIFFLVRVSLRSALSEAAERDAQSVAVTMANAPGRLALLESEQGVTHFRATNARGVDFASAQWQALALDAALAASPTADGARELWWTTDAGDLYLLRVVYTNGATTAVAREARDYQLTMRLLLLTMGIGFPSMLVFATVGGWVMAGRALRPVAAMAREARGITADKLSGRLSVHTPHDELAELAQIFNETLERLESSFQELARFSADASHQIRTPLTAMRTAGQMALTANHGPEQLRDTIATMLDEAEKLNRLVETLLIIARSEAGEMPPRRDPIPLEPWVARYVEVLAVLAEEKRITVRTTVQTPADGVRGDEALLGHALLNLLDNAIKYTPPGGTIWIRSSMGAQHWVLEVEDTGPGIPPHEREAVFRRFFRGAERRDITAGTGLGLPLARRVVESHGGRLTAHAGAGGGALLRIEIPRG